jgi:predicted phosphodiesterase
MKFQYLSDIHTEQYKSNHKKLKKIETFIKLSAPYLLLAGDVDDPFSNLYKEFLSYLSSLFEYIFIIVGNHEYYTQHTMHAIQEEILY